MPLTAAVGPGYTVYHLTANAGTLEPCPGSSVLIGTLLSPTSLSLPHTHSYCTHACRAEANKRGVHMPMALIRGGGVPQCRGEGTLSPSTGLSETWAGLHVETELTAAFRSGSFIHKRRHNNGFKASVQCRMSVCTDQGHQDRFSEDTERSTASGPNRTGGFSPLSACVCRAWR